MVLFPSQEKPHQVSLTLRGDKAQRHNHSIGEKVVSPVRVSVWPREATQAKAYEKPWL